MHVSLLFATCWDIEKKNQTWIQNDFSISCSIYLEKRFQQSGAFFTEKWSGEFYVVSLILYFHSENIPWDSQTKKIHPPWIQNCFVFGARIASMTKMPDVSETSEGSKLSLRFQEVPAVKFRVHGNPILWQFLQTKNKLNKKNLEFEFMEASDARSWSIVFCLFIECILGVLYIMLC